MTMYYLYIDDQQRGPFSIEQLAEMGITPETEVWTEGMDDWQQAGDVPQLTTLLQRLEFERHEAGSRTRPAATRPAATPPTRRTPPPMPPQDSYANQQPAPATATPQPKPRNSGIKWLIALLIVCILLAVMVVTCPDREDHRQAIMGSTRSWVSDKVEERDMGNILGELIKWVSGKGADIAIDELLQVDNHFIYSTGKIMVGAKPKTVSIGVLGHVFTFSKEDIEVALRRAMGMETEATTQPSVGITPEPEPYADEDPYFAPDDTLGGVMPRDDEEPGDLVDALVDSLTRAAKEQAIRMAKEWAKKQIDNL